MTQRNPTLRKVGLIIFFTAILTGVILTLLRAVPDLEANLYGFIKFGYPRLYSLTCPVFMTTQDREPVTIRLHNSLNRTLSYYVEAQLSTPGLMETDDQRLSLQPDESQKLAWEVGRENIDLGNYILVKVFTSAATDNGMRESTCGTFVLNLPFKGGPTIYYALVFLTILGIAIGLWLWHHYRDLTSPSDRVRYGWMIFTAVVILIAVVSSLLNFWFAALLLVFLTLLSSGVYLISQKE